MHFKTDRKFIRLQDIDLFFPGIRTHLTMHTLCKNICSTLKGIFLKKKRKRKRKTSPFTIFLQKHFTIFSRAVLRNPWRLPGWGGRRSRAGKRRKIKFYVAAYAVLSTLAGFTVETSGQAAKTVFIKKQDFFTLQHFSSKHHTWRFVFSSLFFKKNSEHGIIPKPCPLLKGLFLLVPHRWPRLLDRADWRGGGGSLGLAGLKMICFFGFGFFFKWVWRRKWGNELCKKRVSKV